MIKGILLIVDDHKQVLDALSQILEQEFEKVITASNPNSIDSILEKESIDLVLLDMNFTAGVQTGNEGIFWLNHIHSIDKDIQVILMTAYGDVNLAVQVMKEGATDFVLKPWDNEKLIATLQTALKLRQSGKKIRQLESTQMALEETIEKQFDPIVGESSSIKNIFRVIDKVSQTDANILITGENGTGKELIAREIHKKSDRNLAPLITVDLGAISESIFESELFGHSKGAFTDAKSDRKGKFEIASGGTLFLDEIGNLSYNMQAKLLTALQNRMITPVGSNEKIDIDIRLICATNKNLSTMVNEQIFREDLLFRVNTIHIQIPPIRERTDDIPLIADYFLDYYKKKYNKPNTRISNNAYEKLKTYSWPGNIRELKHAIEKAIILSDNEILNHFDFLLENPFMIPKTDHFPRTMDDIEKDAIIKALENNKGNVREAAKELNIARQTLYNKMTKYNI